MSNSRQPLDLVNMEEYLSKKENHMETKRLRAMEKNMRRTQDKIDSEAKLFHIVDESDPEESKATGEVQGLPSDKEINQLKELCLHIDQLQAELGIIKNLKWWQRLIKVVTGY